MVIASISRQLMKQLMKLLMKLLVKNLSEQLGSLRLLVVCLCAAYRRKRLTRHSRPTGLEEAVIYLKEVFLCSAG